jgi:hypothetical protein
MNRWHRLHKRFRRLRTLEERILLAIMGLPEDDPLFALYPDIGTRFSWYAGWLDDPKTCTVRYEDLSTPIRVNAIRRIVGWFLDHSGQSFDLETVATAVAANVNPQRSHTYRRGVSGAWVEVFSSGAKEAMKRRGGRWLQRLDYAASDDW